MSAEESVSVAPTAPAFVDTNVLVYAFSSADEPRRARAQELVIELTASRRLRTSTQVLQELFVTLTKKGLRPLDADTALAILEDVAVWPVFAADVVAIRDAIRLARDAVLSFWDALIVVAASRSGAECLYTEDLNHGQEILGVTVVNPFRDRSPA